MVVKLLSRIIDNVKVAFLCPLFFMPTLCAVPNFSSKQSRIIINGGSLTISNPISSWNGTLEVISGSVSGSDITFDRGGYTTSISESSINGIYAPTNNTLSLTGNHRFRAESGLLSPTISVTGTGNIVEGQPTFVNPITLQASVAELQISIQSKLNKNIIMNGGTIKLLDDLTLADDVILSGSGTVNIGNRTLRLPGLPTTWSSNIIFDNANDIQLDAYTYLSGKWTLTGSSSTINGNCNVLDLSLGGTLEIPANKTAYLTDIHVKGIGEAGRGTILFGNSASQIRLSNSTLEFVTSYTFTTGGFYVEGDHCNVITGTNVVYFTNVASLTIDGVALTYDLLDSTASLTTISPSLPDGQHLIYLNNGILRNISGTISESLTNLIITTSNAVNYYGPIIIQNSNFLSAIDHGPMNIIFSSIVTMSYNIYLSGDHTLNFTGTTADVDGNFHTINLTCSATTPLIILGPGMTVTLNNVFIDGLSPEKIQYGANSQLFFGENVTINLCKNVDLNQTWSFVGNSTIRGIGNSLNLSHPSSLTVASGKTLVLRDMQLTGFGAFPNSIRLYGSTSRLELRTLDLTIDTKFTLTQGFVDVFETVRFRGTDATFAYQSAQDLTIKTDAILTIDHGVTFSYDSQTASSPKNHLVFTDASSILYMNGSTLYATHTGVRLATGRLIIDDKVTFASEATVIAEAIDLASSLNIFILANAGLDIQGLVTYI